MTALLILEGPFVAEKDGLKPGFLKSWRHYQFVSKHKVSNCVGIPERVHATAVSLAAEFHAAGTWEDATAPAAPGSFPTPKPEILAHVHPMRQEEFA